MKNWRLIAALPRCAVLTCPSAVSGRSADSLSVGASGEQLKARMIRRIPELQVRMLPDIWPLIQESKRLKNVNRAG